MDTLRVVIHACNISPQALNSYLRSRCNNKIGGNDPGLSYVESSCQKVEGKEGRIKMVYTYSTQLSSPNKNNLTFMAIIVDPTNSIAAGETKSELDSWYETERSKAEQMNEF